MYSSFNKVISASLSPNTDSDDVWLALRMIVQPWIGKRGKAHEDVEKWFIKRYPSSTIVSVNSGRSALFALLQCFDIGEGDEVLLQAFTCVAVPNSVKWTGATFLLIILILEIKRLPAGKAGWKNLLILAVVPFAIYFSLFALHFALLKNPGPGDAFMKQDFQQKPLMAKFLELNAEMYRSNARLTATHPYSTLPPAGYQKLDWYTWPLMMRPIYYWNHGMAKIYSSTS